MPNETRVVSPGPDERSVRAVDGAILRPPDGWVLVPPGDAALTRRLRAAGPTWSVQEKRGRKILSKGVWAPRVHLERIRKELEEQRARPQYAAQRAAQSRRRDRNQAEYVSQFRAAVLSFLAFHSSHAALAERLADAVTAHATPVGSGTVARTQRIPIQQRAESAVIAWMRHHTTVYDEMDIPRIKGRRREVRRALAERSRALLARYRSPGSVGTARCPIHDALNSISS